MGANEELGTYGVVWLAEGSDIHVPLDVFHVLMKKRGQFEEVQFTGLNSYDVFLNTIEIIGGMVSSPEARAMEVERSRLVERMNKELWPKDWEES